MTGLPSLSWPMRLVHQVDVHRARQRVRHDERRRGEIVQAHVRVDAPFEVAVAREHRGDGEVRPVDGVADAIEQRARVADARGAAEADQVEAELLERLDQAGPLEVVDHDAGAGRERRLHPRLRSQPERHGLLGQQAGADHHLRVRRVGAAGDRGDHDVAVGHLVVRRRRGLAVGGHRACGRARPGRSPSPWTRGTRSCGRLGPASEGSTSPRSRLTCSEYTGSGGAGVVPEPLRLGVGLDQRQVRLVAPGEAQVVEGDLVDREHRARGPVLGAHVADGGPGLEREGGHAGAVALDERADDAVVAQQLGHREHDVGGGDAGLRLARDAQADDRRQEHGQGLAEHGRLGLDPADAPAEHAEPVHHGRVRVGADERVAERAPVVGREHEARQVLEVDLVADARAGRHDAEAVERTLGPAQQLVALHVALVLDGDVAVVGLGVARSAR